MPKKCESCRHFRAEGEGSPFNTARCKSPVIVLVFNRCLSVAISDAREICDQEGDGIFVYFEPKTPAAGQAFAKAA